METKELKIEIPEGFKIDTENSSFEKIVFKKKEDGKPRSWEEYLEQQSRKNETGCFINTDSDIHSCNWGSYMPDTWRNVLPSKELVESFLAMMQLMSLRQAWIGDWKPNWENFKEFKWCIVYYINKPAISVNGNSSRALSFPTSEMADDFMNTFKDLLKIAKPLI